MPDIQRTYLQKVELLSRNQLVLIKRDLGCQGDAAEVSRKVDLELWGGGGHRPADDGRGRLGVGI